jgi:hypothetical protein
MEYALPALFSLTTVQPDVSWNQHWSFSGVQAMNEHYAAVMADLKARRSKLQIELNQIDAAIQGLQLILVEPRGASINPDAAWSVSPKEPPANQRYARISVRWGVLWKLAEYSTDYEKTGQIADALLAGGYQTSGASRFGNMVSAVLSNMKTKGEVESNEEGGYRLTDAGRKTWELIKQGTKFKDAITGDKQPPLAIQ